MSAVSRSALFVVGLLGVALLAGCQSKFTHERFEMIQIGVDDRDDVRHILGEPESELYEQWFYDDLHHSYSAVVHFDADGKVRGKEWMDSKKGTWEGRNPNANDPPVSGEVREQKVKKTRVDDD